MSDTIERKARFTSMDEGTREDWEAIVAHEAVFVNGLADRILAHLRLLDDNYSGFAISRLQHSWQTAHRACRDGRDEEYVVCAVLHDIGDIIGPFNHADIAAAMLKPFVSEQNLWMVKYHALFQGYHYFHHLGMDRNARDQFRGHPFFDYTAEFCAQYDQCSFDPAYETLPLSEFEPMVRRVINMPRQPLFAMPSAA